VTIPVTVTNSRGLNNTLFVNDDGTADYIKIQQALDNANNGDTIFVFNGFYNENIWINKSVNLIGEDKYNTIIDGSKLNNVVNINSNSVNITGFKIIKSGNINNSGDINDAGIKVNSNLNKIYDNNIINNSVGIRIVGVGKNYINCNNISNNYNGIVLFIGMKDNIITDNLIKNNDNDGIHFYRSDSNIITGNSFINNKFNGINMHWSRFNMIYNNNFIKNGVDANDYWYNIWYNTSIKKGNFWHNYSGIDINNDGIGDTPHNISGGINQDLYPLISLYRSELEQDKSPPIVDFLRPENAIYINNTKIISFFIPIIFGNIEIYPFVNDDETNISSIRIYIDNKLTEVFTYLPESIIWDKVAFGKKTIRLVAFDNAGNEASKEIIVFKFF
jgi:parallel beta-helix repeat protein